MKSLLPILSGSILIILLVPALQWLDRSTLVNPLETDAPVPMAVAVLVALVAVNGFCYVLARLRLFSIQSQLVIYVMLMVSVPFANIGLVRAFYTGISSVLGEYLDRRIDTVRQAYDLQNPDYFPKLTEPEYQEYLQLAEKTRTAPQEAEELKARQSEILLPIKRFWTGIHTDPIDVKRFENPEWGLFDRLRASFKSIPWGIWAPVIFHWSMFLGLVLLGAIFFTQVLERDWIDRENVPFPLAQLPLFLLRSEAGERLSEDADESLARDSNLFANGFFWSGVLTGGVLLLFGGLAHYKILNINMDGAVNFQRINFEAIFVNEPWLHVSQNMLLLTPLFIGVALLVHQEILRGVVLIFLGIQALRMLAGISEVGITELIGPTWKGNKLPFYVEMGTGAAIIFGLYLLWQSRNSFAFLKPSQTGNWRNYVPPPMVTVGLLASVCGVIFWLIDLGVSGFAGVFFIIFVLFWIYIAGIVVARARTEAGLPLNTVAFLSHDIGAVSGAAVTHGMSNLFLFANSAFITISALPGLIATQIESLFLARRLKVSPRLILWSVIIAFCLATGIGLISYLTLSYWHGLTKMQHWQYSTIFRWPIIRIFLFGDTNFANPQTEYIRIVMIVVGAGIMLVLLGVRRRFPRYSLPPVCFIIVCIGTMLKVGPDGMGTVGDPAYINFIWGPMLIAFTIKSLMLKYGGMALYNRSIPFLALGLILSHGVMLVFWNIYHALSDPEGFLIFTGVLTTTVN